MRVNYWSCSKFADYILGDQTPTALTSRGWHDWKQLQQSVRPIRYWIAKEGLDHLQDIVLYIPDKLYDVKCYLRNRFITKTHALTAKSTHVKRGQWCDLTGRLLPCLFDELVDFVEIELAWNNIAWNESARKEHKAPWYAVGWFKTATWRSREAGIAYLDWASSLTYNDEWFDKSHPDYNKPTLQALSSIEIKELYTWWTETYPNRPDPDDASGWTDVCEAMREANGGNMFLNECPAELQDQKAVAYEKLRKLEQEYEDEDTEMMIRLIKVRGSLWT
jgi:hypothetical protein